MLLFNYRALHKRHRSLKSVYGCSSNAPVCIAAGTKQRDDSLHFFFCLTKYLINYKRMTFETIKKKKKITMIGRQELDN